MSTKISDLGLIQVPIDIGATSTTISAVTQVEKKALGGDTKCHGGLRDWCGRQHERRESQHYCSERECECHGR